MKLGQNSNADYPELQAQISRLQQQLDEAHAVNQAMWSLLVEISRRLQVSSAAIKAAVSSLLGYDIFWDGSTQHELLEIIDNSADQVSSQITLLSLAFRSESHHLEIKPEPNEIQEILSSVTDSLGEAYPELNLDLDMSPNGSPVLVDYEYLSVALKLLFDVIAEAHAAARPIRVAAREERSGWRIDIFGVAEDVLDFISTNPLCLADELAQDKRLLPTNKLKLLVMCRILGSQSIQIEAVVEKGKPASVCLLIPLAHS